MDIVIWVRKHGKHDHRLNKPAGVFMDVRARGMMHRCTTIPGAALSREQFKDKASAKRAAKKLFRACPAIISVWDGGDIIASRLYGWRS